MWLVADTVITCCLGPAGRAEDAAEGQGDGVQTAGREATEGE